MRSRIRLGVLGVVVGLGLLTQSASAQSQTRYPRPVFRFDQDLTVPLGTEVYDVTVVSGALTVEGRVTRSAVVWLGNVRLTRTAVIDGSLIVMGGNVTVEDGATIGRDLVLAGGTLTAPIDFAPGRDHAVFGLPAVGRGARAAVPWVMRGLLWGRPLVPDLAWVWAVVGIAFALSVALVLIFGQAVRSASDVVVERPLRTFITGILVLIIVGPLLAIFAATIVGLVVIPVLLFALLVAWTVGKVGVARGIGHRVFHERDPDNRFQALRSLVIGFGLVTLAYMVPILGLITWSLVSVFGLGAASIAMMATLRREYPRKPKPPKAPKAPKGAAPIVPTGPPPPAMPLSTAEPEPTVEAPTDAGDVPPDAGDVPPDAGGRPPSSARGMLALPKAEFLPRAAAFALDCVLIGIVDRLLDSRQDGMYFILLVSYHIAFWTWQGTTLGGIIVGLRVVRTDGGPLRFVDGLVRGLSSMFSIAVLGLGCFWMLQDPDHQTWHDKIAGTYVLKVPRHFPLA